MTDKLHGAPWVPSSLDWQQLADCLRAADLDSLEIEAPGLALRMVRGAQGYQIEPIPTGRGCLPAPASQSATVRAPVAGEFLQKHPLGVPRISQPGELVPAGTVIGFMQIDCLLVPVLAPCGGTLDAWAVASGTLVGYGTELVTLKEGGHDGD